MGELLGGGRRVGDSRRDLLGELFKGDFGIHVFVES